MSHTCYSEMISLANGNVKLKYIKTSASNLKILSFSRETNEDDTRRTVSASGWYGMNGSWFDMNGDGHIMNLAYDDGVRQGAICSDASVPTINGVKVDGFTNSVGKTLIYYRQGQVMCASNVSTPDYRCTDSLWAQGGIGLYLCNTNGYQKFVNEGGGLYTSDTTSRSALVVNINTNKAYLITTPTAVKVKDFRLAIMDNFAISEGDPDIWKGILLDGGGSTQLLGSDVQVSSNRKIPQMIALAND